MVRLTFLPLRFLVTVTHLCVLVLVGNAYYANVKNRLTVHNFDRTESERKATIDEYVEEVKAIYAASVVCIVWELSSMCLMYSTYWFLTSPIGARQSLQNKFAQPLHLSSNNGPDTTRTGILFHTIGTVVTIWYGLDGWSSEYFLGIFFLFCFVPAVIDALAFMFYSCVHWNTRVRAPEDIKGSLYRCICCSRCRESASDGGETRRGDGSAHMGTRKRPDEATRLLDSESDEEDEDDDDNDGKSSEPDTKEVEGDTGEDTEGDRSEDDEAEEKIRTEGDEEPEEGGSASDVSDVGPLTDDSEDDDDDKRPKRKGRGRSKRRAAV